MGNCMKPGLREFFNGKRVRRRETRHHLKNAHKRETRKHFKGRMPSSDDEQLLEWYFNYEYTIKCHYSNV